MTSERQRALLRTGWLAMTIPDKPRSSKQRHITTETEKEDLKTEKLFLDEGVNKDRNYEV
ncbi:MAG: hypothetical protein Q7J15_07305 [Candidatus Desulfaltia sp.]|nr:hypothetical protein [Candidatus Desulfaltia sp.]